MGLRTCLVAFVIVAFLRALPVSPLVREEKLLNLFTIVRFPQDTCNAMAGMVGTCMTSTECTASGGRSGNPCALGFGVCCAFIRGCGDVIRRNCSYIQNPGYPIADNSDGVCKHTIKKCSPNICSIRFDFDMFQIADPNIIDDATDNGNCVTDMISFSSGSGVNPPNLCGTLTGQHLYMDAGGPGSSMEISVTHTFNGDSERVFKYKVTQVPCGSPSAPPPGCSMYLTGTSGTFQSYNYAGGFHLNDQNHRICVRQEEGYCKIQYRQTDDPFSFKLTGNANSQRGSAGDRFCRGDYLFIPMGRNTDVTTPDGCRGTVSTSHKDRFCGSVLNCIQGTTKRRTIISDAPGPFYVQYVTDSNDNDFPNNNFGFSLRYMQVPC